MHTPNHHSVRASGAVRLGDPVLDRYLEFVESRARHNTVLATASDLKAFFRVVDKAPADVTSADVLGFITEQRKPKGDGRVVRLADGESGLAARTIKRRLSSVSGLFSYLVLCGDVTTNPVPRGLATRRQGSRGPALIRSPRMLPKILTPEEVNALMAALRTHRDRAWSRPCFSAHQNPGSTMVANRELNPGAATIGDLLLGHPPLLLGTGWAGGFVAGGRRRWALGDALSYLFFEPDEASAAGPVRVHRPSVVGGLGGCADRRGPRPVDGRSRHGRRGAMVACILTNCITGAVSMWVRPSRAVISPVRYS
jgi:hypothetical protein